MFFITCKTTNSMSPFYTLSLCTLSLMFGIWWHSLSLYSACFFIPATFTCLFVYKKKRRPLFLVILFFTLGSFLHRQPFEQQQNFFCLTQKQNNEIIGTVTALDKTTSANKFKHTITVKLSKIQNNDSNWQSCSNCIQLYTTKKYTLSVGDIINIKQLSFKQPSNKDFNRYLLRNNIVATVFCFALEYTLIKRPRFHIARWLHKTKNNLFYTFKKKLSRSSFELFSSIFLGNKTTIKKNSNVKDVFKLWGLSHYLARSGLHLVILLFALQILLSFFPLAYNAKQLLFAFLGSIYFLLTWQSLSFNRAFLLFALHKLCALTRLQTHFLYLLTLVCLCTLVYNPLHLFFLDFQLSFGLTYALAWLNKIRLSGKKIEP